MTSELHIMINAVLIKAVTDCIEGQYLQEMIFDMNNKRWRTAWLFGHWKLSAILVWLLIFFWLFKISGLLCGSIMMTTCFRHLRFRRFAVSLSDPCVRVMSCALSLRTIYILLSYNHVHCKTILLVFLHQDMKYTNHIYSSHSQCYTHTYTLVISYIYEHLSLSCIISFIFWWAVDVCGVYTMSTSQNTPLSP